MKNKSLNVPATLDIARYTPSWTITRHKSKHDSSVFGINHIKLHPTTENDFLQCQSSWFFYLKHK